MKLMKRNFYAFVFCVECKKQPWKIVWKKKKNFFSKISVTDNVITDIPLKSVSNKLGADVF